MDVLHTVACGIDVSKTDVKVCVLAPGLGRKGQTRTFGTTTPELAEMTAWLAEHGPQLTVLESTSSYWRPVFWALEEAGLEAWLVNPRHVKNVPGRKTDVSDAQWLARLAQHGLLRPSFVPPRQIRRLRDLTRTRTVLTRERVRTAARLHALLEDAGIKLGSVATDILGVSGRAMLDALIAGRNDPEALADLAKRALRRKKQQLEAALTGRFDEHHAFVAQTLLDHIDHLGNQIDRLSTQIHTTLEVQQRHILDLLVTIPGVSTRIAEIIIAETGADMTRFPTPDRLASWAGLAPGNNQSGPRRRPAATTKGNTWLKGALGQAAAAAARTKNTYLAARYRRIATRRGKLRAQVALAHTILTSTWHMITTDSPYHDLGPDHHLHHTNRNKQVTRRIRELQALGYQVTLTPTGAAPS